MASGRWPGRLVRIGPLLAGAALAGAACRTATPIGPTLPPGPTVAGRVEFEALADPALPEPALGENQEVEAAILLERTLPAYPVDALRPDAPVVVVSVRIVVGEDGCVEEIGPSPVASSSVGPDQGLFEEAVRTALLDWSFHPPAVRTLAPGSDVDGDGEIDYSVVTRREPIRVAYDLRFRFEVVDGRGAVSVGLAGGESSS